MFRKCKRFAIFAVFGLLFACGAARAQEGVEPQARGPVHEAYANPVERRAQRRADRGPGTAARNRRSTARSKTGRRKRHLGSRLLGLGRRSKRFPLGQRILRIPPPNRTWVPGSWRQAGNGYQWVAGYWAQPELPETQYLPQPPAPIEAGPSVPAPGPDYVYVPGSWVYSTNRYLWRPGVWTIFRPGWVWIPAHYHWTPVGYVFVNGYWDYTLRDRGILFSPVVIDRRYWRRPNWHYVPSYVVYDESLFGALFVRPGYSHYYFGDYFDVRFSKLGYHSWFSVSFSRGYTYDPLFSYYSVHYRRDPHWAPAIREVYVARYAGDLPRPSVRVGVSVNFNFNTFAANPAMARKYTNITRTTNVVNVTNVTNNVVNIKNINNNTVNRTNVNNQFTKFKLQTVTPAQKEHFVAAAKQSHAVAKQRVEIETKLHNQGGAVGKNGTPRSVKMNLPKPVISTQNSGTGTKTGTTIHHNPPPPATRHGAPPKLGTGSGGNQPKTGTGGSGNRPKLGTGSGGNRPKLGAGGGNQPKTGTGASGSGNRPKTGVGSNPPRPGPGAGPGKPLGGKSGSTEKDKEKKKDR